MTSPQPFEYVYIFVRQDLLLAQQIVQACHAVLSMSQWFRVDGIPNVILIGVPNLPALLKACKKLDDAKIAYYAWHEPDFDYGFTALATVPIEGERRSALANYRVYSPVVSIAKMSPAQVGEDAGARPARGTNAAVAQEEQPRIIGRSECENPPSGSNRLCDPVAQSGRATGSRPAGRGFKSLRGL